MKTSKLGEIERHIHQLHEKWQQEFNKAVATLLKSEKKWRGQEKNS